MIMEVLESENVSYCYFDVSKGQYVFKGINYSFKEGNIYAIKGKSRSGYSILKL